MAHAETCPICNGSGKIAIRGGKLDTTALASPTKTCHGCGGTGWVTVK